MIGNPILLLLVVGPMAAAVIGYLIGRVNKSARDYSADAVTILTFLAMAFFFLTYKEGQEVSLVVPEVCGMGLSFKLDGFRIIFASVTAFMWMMTTIFSKEYLAHARNRNRYYFFLLVTFGATMGVFLSDDLFTTFVFFEIMSLASYVCRCCVSCRCCHWRYGNTDGSADAVSCGGNTAVRCAAFGL